MVSSVSDLDRRRRPKSSWEQEIVGGGGRVRPRRVCFRGPLQAEEVDVMDDEEDMEEDLLGA